MNSNCMGYRQWQKRNTDVFCKLSQDQQQAARQQGYFNISWQKVQQSWIVLQHIAEPPTLFNAKLKKGDLVGAVNQSILEAEQAQQIARQGITDLEHSYKQVKKLAKTTLNEYQLL